jgi:hypothetical protein
MAKGKRRATTNNGWRQVAPLVPVALFASAFTVSATDEPTVATAALESGSSMSRNDPIVVPSRAIDDPANYPVPGTVANGVNPDEQPTQVVSGLSRNGIPQAALRAYSRAQQVMSTADPGCNLPWTLVAAIGRVESNHGRHGGNVLNADGLAVPGILGPRLDGARTARIPDTDGGRDDGDKSFDRAVGPMQFIPGTWRLMGVDGDGDGIRNPQDIDDAAMSTAVYLCSGETNLAQAGDLNQALLRYNHSQSYVDLVVSIAKAYAGGSWIAVENGLREGDNQGVDRADDRIGDPTIDPPEDPLDRAIVLPVEPTNKPTTRPTTSRPTNDPTTDPTTTPTTVPTSRPTSRPTETTEPPVTTKPPALPEVPELQTAVGVVVGTAGSTLAELTKAATYCQSEMAKVTITSPTQYQLQKCVTAFQTGGTAAVDQVIRNLLSVLGLIDILGGGVLGS